MAASSPSHGGGRRSSSGPVPLRGSTPRRLAAPARAGLAALLLVAGGACSADPDGGTQAGTAPVGTPSTSPSPVASPAPATTTGPGLPFVPNEAEQELLAGLTALDVTGIEQVQLPGPDSADLYGSWRGWVVFAGSSRTDTDVEPTRTEVVAGLEVSVFEVEQPGLGTTRSVRFRCLDRFYGVQVAADMDVYRTSTTDGALEFAEALVPLLPCDDGS